MIVILLLILIVLFIVLFILLLNYYYNKPKKSTNKKLYMEKKVNTKIPKTINNKFIIWSCWPGIDKIPEYLKLCHQTVKKHNEKYFNVILVTPYNLNQYIDNLHPAYEYLSYVHKADYLRCILLDKYGGMYLDIDTICFNRLTYPFSLLKNNCIVGYDGKKCDEIWGMSVIGPLSPDTEYTNQWKSKLFKILDNKLNELIEYRKKYNDLKKDCIGWSEILRDIILPISKKINNYKLVEDDWDMFDNKKVLKTENLSLKNYPNLLILNNYLYSEDIKSMNYDSIMKSDILLHNLLKTALQKNNITVMYNVDKIFYINLKKRTDRNENMKKQLSIFPKDNILRFDAVQEKNGALGCLKSHIKMLEYALENFPRQNIMFCEDDIQFLVNPLNYINEFFNNPELFIIWDVIMLSHNTQKQENTKYNNIIRLTESQTSACYIINYRYINVLLNIFKNSLKNYEISNLWKEEYCTDQSWKKLQAKDNWYTFKNKKICKQIESYSDIENKIVDYGV